jgi:uncharacterized protein (TIGR00369 family)
MQGMEDDGQWHDMPDPCAFADLMGPLQRRREGGSWVYALLVQPKHTNTAGILHGGALTALLDEVLGNTVNDEAGRRHVTVHSDVTFLRRVEVGDFVEAGCEVVRRTRSMTFVEARVRVKGELVATAQSVFKAVP